MLIPKQKKQMIKLIEVVDNEGHYNLREVIINSSHVVSMTCDDYCAGLHASGKLPTGLHEAQEFSKVTLTNGKEIVVVGSPDLIGTRTKNILHG